jgi:hypothetical protein
MDKQLQALRRRLENAELEHLRQHCAEQAERIEELERDRDYWQDCALSADARADMFMRMAEDPHYSTHRAVGINRAGELMVIAQ